MSLNLLPHHTYVPCSLERRGLFPKIASGKNRSINFPNGTNGKSSRIVRHTNGKHSSERTPKLVIPFIRCTFTRQVYINLSTLNINGRDQQSRKVLTLISVPISHIYNIATRFGTMQGDYECIPFTLWRELR